MIVPLIWMPESLIVRRFYFGLMFSIILNEPRDLCSAYRGTRSLNNETHLRSGVGCLHRAGVGAGPGREDTKSAKGGQGLFYKRGSPRRRAYGQGLSSAFAELRSG